MVEVFLVLYEFIQRLLVSIDATLHVVGGALIGAMAYIATTPPNGVGRGQRFLLFVASWGMGVYAAAPTYRIANVLLRDYVGVEIPFGKPYVAFLMAALGIWLIESIKAGKFSLSISKLFGGRNGTDKGSS